MLDLEFFNGIRTTHDKKYRRLKLRSASTICNISISNQEKQEYLTENDTQLTFTLNRKEIELLYSSLGYVLEDLKSREK